jgi:DNA replication and repair protein RecF
MPRLTALRLRDFRCFSQLSCEFADGVTLFVGDNAEGKSSVLEAVCVLLRLQSPRASSLDELVRFGESGFGLSGDIGPHRVQVTFQHGKRQLVRNGAAVGSAADYLAESELIVWMGNDDLQLVRGSGESRRRYLDFLGTQAYGSYRPASLAYEKALRSRNRLLKDEPPDPRQLDVYTRLLIEHGTTLTHLRSRLVKEVAPLAADAHRQVSERDEFLTMSYEPSTGDDFATALLAAAEDEQRRHLTLIGPHRDDVALDLNESSASRFASEGQQRTIALALKLAQSRLLESLHATPPLLLIDDVFGELDPGRRNALLRALPPGSQKIITATNLDWLHQTTVAGVHTFQIANGRLTPQI